jgi:hypothetical protein
VPRGKYVRLLAIIDAYETKETESGIFRHAELVESIISIRLAAFNDFWQEETLPLPGAGEITWCEVWLRSSREDAAGVHQRFASLAQSRGMKVSERYIRFPERTVTWPKTMSRFHDYSLNNQMLSAFQRADATHVGFHA